MYEMDDMEMTEMDDMDDMDDMEMYERMNMSDVEDEFASEFSDDSEEVIYELEINNLLDKLNLTRDTNLQKLKNDLRENSKNNLATTTKAQVI
jgi:uncharacterized membrane protein